MRPTEIIVTLANTYATVRGQPLPFLSRLGAGWRFAARVPAPRACAVGLDDVALAVLAEYPDVPDLRVRRKRGLRLVEAKGMYYMLAVELTRHSHPEIAARVGRATHSSSVTAANRMVVLCLADAGLRATRDRIINRIRSQP